ncbi:MAG: DUF1456 family protein [Saprospiraceae bacterium]
MDNNVILRRLRYNFDFSDAQMISLFAAAKKTVTRAEVSNWLKKEQDSDFEEINDETLASFLNGFITDRRGQREGPQRPVETKLNNNIIFRKLKIALNLKDGDVLEILNAVDLPISKHELSAFFRKPEQRQYRECKDQILRNFLHGLQLKHRK